MESGSRPRPAWESEPERCLQRCSRLFPLHTFNLKLSFLSFCLSFFFLIILRWQAARRGAGGRQGGGGSSRRAGAFLPVAHSGGRRPCSGEEPTSLTAGESQACSAVGSCTLGSCPLRCPPPPCSRVQEGQAPCQDQRREQLRRSRTTRRTAQGQGPGRGRSVPRGLQSKGHLMKVESGIQNAFIHSSWGP